MMDKKNINNNNDFEKDIDNLQEVTSSTSNLNNVQSAKIESNRETNTKTDNEQNKKNLKDSYSQNLKYIIKYIGRWFWDKIFKIAKYLVNYPEVFRQKVQEHYLEERGLKGILTWDEVTKKYVWNTKYIPFFGVTDKTNRRHSRDWKEYTEFIKELTPKEGTFGFVGEYLGGYITTSAKIESTLRKLEFSQYTGFGLVLFLLLVCRQFMAGDMHLTPLGHTSWHWLLYTCFSLVVVVILDQGFASKSYYTYFKDYGVLTNAFRIEWKNIGGAIYLITYLLWQDWFWFDDPRGTTIEKISAYEEDAVVQNIRRHYKARVAAYCWNRFYLPHVKTIQELKSLMYHELSCDITLSWCSSRLTWFWFYFPFYKYLKTPWIDCDYSGGRKSDICHFFFSPYITTYKLEKGTGRFLEYVFGRYEENYYLWEKRFYCYALHELAYYNTRLINYMYYNYGISTADFINFSFWQDPFTPENYKRLYERLELYYNTEYQAGPYLHHLFLRTFFIAPMCTWYNSYYWFTLVPTYFYDAPWEYQLGFQDPATPIMEGIIDLHHDLFFFFIIIGSLVFWLIFRIIYFFHWEGFVVPENFFRKIKHNTLIEVIWTITPALILVLIATPSFSLLYAMEDIIKPGLTIKVIGNQWYWSYEYFIYPTNENKELLNFDKTKNNTIEKIFDSYMVATEDLQLGEFRLLEVDNRVIVPTLTHIRFLITSSDVLHSFAIPSLGIKLDACPGRLNQTTAFITRQGLFYGQCSEICGINHAFMPIVIEAVDTKSMLMWLNK